MSYLLEPKVRFHVIKPNLPQIPDGFTDVFVFNPSREFHAAIETEKKSKLELAYKPDQIWRLKK